MAKEQLGELREAKQDWQTALKLASKTNNIKLINEIKNVLQQSSDSQIESDFKDDALIILNAYTRFVHYYEVMKEVNTAPAVLGCNA